MRRTKAAPIDAIDTYLCCMFIILPKLFAKTKKRISVDELSFFSTCQWHSCTGQFLNEYFLTTISMFSKWIEAVSMESCTQSLKLLRLSQWFCLPSIWRTCSFVLFIFHFHFSKNKWRTNNVDILLPYLEYKREIFNYPLNRWKFMSHLFLIQYGETWRIDWCLISLAYACVRVFWLRVQ